MRMLKIKLRNIHTISKFMLLKNTNIKTTVIENTFLKTYQLLCNKLIKKQFD